jgi:hypothetical protein
MGIKMKVVFLDFDGVLIPLGKASISDRTVGAATEQLKSLLKKEPEAKIVISSAWRRNGLGYCKIFLEGLGIDPDRVIGMTDFERGSRGYQIQCYLKRNREVTHFVILDDNGDMDDLKTRLVKTSPLIGLTKEDVEKAIEILNR